MILYRKLISTHTPLLEGEKIQNIPVEFQILVNPKIKQLIFKNWKNFP